MRGSIQVRIAIFGAGLFASEGWPGKLRPRPSMTSSAPLSIASWIYHAGPELGIGRSPGRLRRLSDRNSLRQDCGVAVLKKSLHLSAARIEDRGGDGTCVRDALGVDEMADRAHQNSLSRRIRNKQCAYSLST